MAAGAPVPRGVGQDGAYFVRREGDVAGSEAFVRTEYRRGVGLRVSLGLDYQRGSPSQQACTYIYRVAIPAIIPQETESDVIHVEHLTVSDERLDVSLIQ